MNSFTKWIRAVRVPTLTASVIPVALGGMLAYLAHSFHPVSIILAVIAMTFFQITSNLINDVDDFNNKVDTKESFGSSRVIVDALLTQKQVMAVAALFFFTAIAIGIYLSIIGGIIILILGTLGAASAFFYTRKPFEFKYKGYGVPLIFLMFGPLPVLGTYYLSVGAFSLTPLILSVPIGLMTTAILHANDLRDLEHDTRAGIKSLAIALGTSKARLLYLILVGASFVCVFLCVLFGLLSFWSMLVLFTIPHAIMLIKNSKIPEKLKTLDHKTAALQMIFGILLLISIAL